MVEKANPDFKGNRKEFWEFKKEKYSCIEEWYQ